MARRTAQGVTLVSIWACSGQTVDPAPEAMDPKQTDTADRDLSRRDENVGGTDENDSIHSTEGATLAPLTSTIRVRNGSGETRSRYRPCAAPDIIGIRPATAALPVPSPTCVPTECATLPEGEILPPERECTMAACASLRSDLAPGAADSDFSWDGVFFQLTSRNCYDATTFEPGTPMLAHICYGTPVGQYDVSAFTCTDYPFVYGTPLVEIELE